MWRAEGTRGADQWGDVQAIPGYGGAQELPQRILIDPALAVAVAELCFQNPTGHLARRYAPAYQRAARRITAHQGGRRRQEALRQLGRSFFAHLGHEETLRDTLREFPRLGGVGHVVVLEAPTRVDEGTKLRHTVDHPGAGPAGVLRARPQRFADESSLRSFLRFHWLQLDDCLDPSFGYVPGASSGGRPPYDHPRGAPACELAWAIHTVGRLQRRGWAAYRSPEELTDALERLVGPTRPGTVARWVRKLSSADFLPYRRILDIARALCDAGRVRHAEAVAVCDVCGFPSTVGRILTNGPDTVAPQGGGTGGGVEGFVCESCHQQEQPEAPDARGKAIGV